MIVVTSFSYGASLLNKENQIISRKKGCVMKSNKQSKLNSIFSLFIFSLVFTFITACSSTGPKKVVLDQSSKKKPSWAESSKLSWKKKNHIFFKSAHTIRADERANGCIDLAKLDTKENLISEVKDEIKGSIDNAQQSISVDAEVVLGKVRSSGFEGAISGLRFTESYWEKYELSNGEAATTCYVLSQIEEKDYIKMKKNVLKRVIALEPRIKEAINKKQINFFDGSERKINNLSGE